MIITWRGGPQGNRLGRSKFALCCLGNASGRGKPAFDIGEDVADMFDADGKPHIAIRDTGRVLLLGRELGVRGGGRMDRETASIADIRYMVEELQRIDKTPPRVAAADELESHPPKPPLR